MVTFRFSYVTEEFANALNDALAKSLANISGLVLMKPKLEAEVATFGNISTPDVNSPEPVVTTTENETVVIEGSSPVSGTVEEVTKEHKTVDFGEFIKLGMDKENNVLILDIGKSDDENDDVVIECSQLMSMEEEDSAPQESKELPSLEEELAKEEQSIPELTDTEVVSDVNEKIDKAMETDTVPSEEEEAKPEDNHIS